MIAFVSSVETPSIIPNSFYFCSVSLVGSSKREFAEYRLELQPGLKILGVARGGLLGLIFAGYVPLASQSPYPIIVYSVANYRPHLSHFWANMQFSRSQLEKHFTFHLQYKHPGTFANRKNEELSYPKNPKMCDPILVTLLKMRPHCSQFIRENATLSSRRAAHPH